MRSGMDTLRVSRPVVRLAISGIALGFSAMIISVAIVKGFKQEIREKVIGFSAHVQISKFDANQSFESSPIEFNTANLSSIAKLEGVRHVQAFATKAGIVRKGSEIEGVIAKGVDSGYDWSFFRKSLRAGAIPVYANSSRSSDILISTVLARKLNLNVSDSLVTYFVQQPPRARKFKIVGIYETGLEEFDEKFVFCDLAQIRKLNDWNDSTIGGLEVQLSDFDALDEAAPRIYATTGSDLDVRTIREMYPQIFDWLGLQDINAVVIIILMIIVAGINMIAALLVLILERVGTIGTLKAIGASDASVRNIFLRIAALLISRGLFWGNVVGIGICLLQHYFHWIRLDQDSYYIAYVPIRLLPLDLLWMNLGTLLVCTMMMLVPTLLVTRIRPVRALRFR
ncbi:MAG: ABC transporter permease [Bacteroidota bacterium]|uniref:ABC transporter permease n=1 Tax=Candidatus Pollutiaquabacter sp. TaxID=3416354 RepID=UPI001A3BF59D|nr:ABC transporter permease [Bacteroidota bacterium]MBL7947772.1 ABC transporter permease [Bacteroidia bacterium]MBP6010365.1 ABC transporter permease [Bacteroidia bacterium]MBP7270054.1 ABC transporter permease [Bacteroidia bacterium]MBP7436385.1 ABC transporter permease [Bacteroidia bacterium]